MISANHISFRRKAITHCPQGHAYDGQNTRVNKDGRRVCRTCERTRHQSSDKRAQLERVLRYNTRHPEKLKETRMKSDLKRAMKKKLKPYGLTPEQYDTMVIAQDGVCAICMNTCAMGRRLSVDHDHKTGAVRGLLCGGCNAGLGRFSDDISRLQAAIRYLSGGPLS